MKIVLLSSGLPDSIGDLANSLSNNVDILLIVPKKMPGDFSEDYLSKKVKYKFYDEPRQRNLKSIYVMLEIVKSIKKYNPDVIHIYHHGNPWYSLLYPFLKKYPIVHTIHDPTPHHGEKKLRYMFRNFICLRNSERFLVMSNRMKQKMVEYYNINPEKIDITPLALPLRYCKLQKEVIAEENNSVLFFGRIWKYKGLEYLIKAEPIISKEIENLKIVIAGRGEDFDKYREIMKDETKYHIINQYIKDSEVNELFQKSSIVVMPYVESTQSNIMLLAYYFRRPVITTNVGGIPEFVINKETGILVPPRDVNALARAIILLLQKSKFRKDMGKKGHDYFGNHFNWDKVADETVKCYNKCLRIN